MNRAPHNLNRVLLLIIGIVLIAVSVYGLARSFNAFGTDRAHQPLITPDLVNWLDNNHAWVWTLVAVAGAIAVVLGLLWLLAQLHQRPGAVDWTVGQSGGTTVVSSDGVAAAVENDLLELDAVDHVDARLVGDRHEPALDLRVVIDDDASASEMAQRISARLAERLHPALEVDHLPTTLTLDLVTAHRRLA